MTLVSKHKALILTTLIAAIIVLSMFNLHLSKNMVSIAESYYELEPEDIIKEKEDTKTTLTNSTKQTNLAFNESADLKNIDDDYLDKVKEHYEKYAKSTEEAETTPNEVNDLKNTESNTDESDDEAYSTFNRINNLLASKAKKQKSTKSKGDNATKEISITTGANKNSTMSYSLVGRTHKFLPTPIYLCETSGKIVINITVNSKGIVTETSVNGSSTSTNECLIDHALEYAENARFSVDPSRKSQIGTITFSFIGKN